MRRIAWMMLVMLFALTACGGAGTADTTVPVPPSSTAIAKSDNTKIQQTLDSLGTAVTLEMTNHKIKPETIKQQSYQSTASLQDINTFYERELIAKGWVKSQRMPEPQNGVLVTGYEINSNTTLSITAIDATQLGGTGTIIYTAEGNI